MHSLVKPGFQPAGIFVEGDRLCNATMVKTELPGPFLDMSRIITYRQVSAICWPGMDNIGNLTILLSFIP